MKNLFLIFVGLHTFLLCSAIEDGYNDAMRSTINTLNEARSIEEFQQCANTFERIAASESKEWLPRYYASYALIMLSFEEEDLSKKDPILDKAQNFLDQALLLVPNESELHVLQAFLYPSRMMVDPMQRGMLFMDKMYSSLELAKKLDPENPRIYFLQANTTLHMPESMGGGSELAKPIFILADQKFEAFQPASDIHPDWGKETNDAELEKLN